MESFGLQSGSGVFAAAERTRRAGSGTSVFFSAAVVAKLNLRAFREEYGEEGDQRMHRRC